MVGSGGAIRQASTVSLQQVEDLTPGRPLIGREHGVFQPATSPVGITTVPDLRIPPFDEDRFHGRPADVFMAGPPVVFMTGPPDEGATPTRSPPR